MEKVKISEPHKFKIGGHNYSKDYGVNFIKIEFYEAISEERATEISEELMGLISKK